LLFSPVGDISTATHWIPARFGAIFRLVEVPSQENLIAIKRVRSQTVGALGLPLRNKAKPEPG
jgi:hypothetical protein